MDANVSQNVSPNVSPKFPQSKSARKRQRAKERELELKESDFDEWRRRKDLRNDKRRERRQIAKEENPIEYQEKVSEESAKRQERRQKAKLQNPEIHSDFLASEKQKRENKKRETLNDLFDSLFHENKHTFPTPVSKTLWEKLKKAEIDFLFSDIFSPGEITVNSLHSYRQEQLDFLRNNLKFPHGGSVIFYIKTMVHRPKDQRIICKDEIDYINSLILPELIIDEDKVFKRREYYEKNREKEIECSKSSYETKKSNQKNYNINIRFMKADPNKVLSVNDITMNPFVSNFCAREEFKINLWNQDKNPEYLEKWKRQREDYEREVAELSVE